MSADYREGSPPGFGEGRYPVVTGPVKGHVRGNFRGYHGIEDAPGCSHQKMEAETYKRKQLNSANNHMSSEKDLELWKRMQPG